MRRRSSRTPAVSQRGSVTYKDKAGVERVGEFTVAGNWLTVTSFYGSKHAAVNHTGVSGLAKILLYELVRDDKE